MDNGNGTNDGTNPFDGRSNCPFCYNRSSTNVFNPEQILVQHHHNPGIKYEYLLPINTNQNTGSDEEGEFLIILIKTVI